MLCCLAPATATVPLDTRTTHDAICGGDLYFIALSHSVTLKCVTGHTRDINHLVWGVDLVEQHLIASCGLTAKPLIAKRPLLRLAEYSINAPRTGEE